MSKRKVPSLDRSKVTTVASLSSYQSAWMAHWKVAKPPPPHKSNLFILNCETRESDSTSGQEVTSSPPHVPKRDHQFCQVPVKKTVNAMDIVNNTVSTVDGTTVAVVSPNLTEEEQVSASSLALGLHQPGNATFTPRNKQASSFSNDEAWNPLAMLSSSRNWIDGNVDGSKQLFASENFMGKKSVIVSTSYQESPSQLSSRQMARSLDADGNLLVLSTEKLDRHASVITPSPWNRATSLLQNDNRPTGQERLLALLTKNCHQGFPGHHPAFPSQSSHLEVTKWEMFPCENSSRQTHHPVVDVKAWTPCSFVNSGEGLKACQPMFSQTTRQFFDSEKTDTHMSKRDKTFLQSTVHTNQGNGALGQFLSLSMNDNYHGNSGVKLQPLWSLTDSEDHENPLEGGTSAVAMKSESSAETNTLDIDPLPGKHHPGEASSPVKKSQKPSSEKGSGGLVKVDLRERKRKFLELSTTSSSTENGERSPSKTQSLEVEHLLPHDDPGGHPTPGACFTGAKLRHLRMKQLKASESDHLVGSLKMGDASPVEKVNNLFGRITMQMNVSSEPIGCDTLDEQLTGWGLGSGKGRSAQSAKDGVSTSGDKNEAEKGSRVLLSDPWIHRWCRDQSSAQPKKQEPVVLCEPLSTKSLDELQKKQMPSVAAMALMGKTINGFHPCEFKKRGSFIVWNS